MDAAAYRCTEGCPVFYSFPLSLFFFFSRLLSDFLRLDPSAKKMGEEKAKSAGVWTTVKPLVNAGASGMLATCVIQPVDMIKAPS